jgi:hypothetical protein
MLVICGCGRQCLHIMTSRFITWIVLPLLTTVDSGHLGTLKSTASSLFVLQKIAPFFRHTCYISCQWLWIHYIPINIPIISPLNHYIPWLIPNIFRQPHWKNQSRVKSFQWNALNKSWPLNCLSNHAIMGNPYKWRFYVYIYNYIYKWVKLSLPRLKIQRVYPYV